MGFIHWWGSFKSDSLHHVLLVDVIGYNQQAAVERMKRECGERRVDLCCCGTFWDTQEKKTLTKGVRSGVTADYWCFILMMIRAGAPDLWYNDRCVSGWLRDGGCYSLWAGARVGGGSAGRHHVGRGRVPVCCRNCRWTSGSQPASAQQTPLPTYSTSHSVRRTEGENDNISHLRKRTRQTCLHWKTDSFFGFTSSRETMFTTMSGPNTDESLIDRGNAPETR